LPDTRDREARTRSSGQATSNPARMRARPVARPGLEPVRPAPLYDPVDMSAQRNLVVAVLVVVGVLALAVGVIYLTVEAKSLPSFMGQLHGDHAHRSLRGIVALIVGVLLLAGGAGLFAYRPATSR
jgi:hypothetical protein